jgi:hypothetical protein
MAYKCYLNGKQYDVPTESISAMEDAAKRADAAERHRPLTESEVSRLIIRQQVNTLDVDDQTAVRMTAFYPAWESGQAYTAGYKVQRNGKLWRCIQAHTSQDSWAPSTDTASLWERIDEEHTGDQYDPIPYEGNMALVSGLYYSQDGEVYLCNRDTGSAVYNALSELVGLYVEAI